MFEDQLGQLATDPPRRPDLLPGLRYSAIVPRGALLFLVIFVAFFAIVPLTIMRSDPMMRLELGASRTAPARVLTATDVAGCRSAGARRLIYVFTPAPGREVRGIATVCEDSLYYSVKSGDEVEVQFLSGDPAVNILRSNARTAAPPLAFLAILPLFVLMILAPMFMPQIREGLRARRLWARGRVTAATVVFAKKRFSAGGTAMAAAAGAEVYVEFRNAAGERREAIGWCQNDWLLNQLKAGETVHVAHDERSDRVALLEAFLR